jgi:hypothetical protein
MNVGTGRGVISTQVRAEESSLSVQFSVLNLFSVLKDRLSIPVFVLSAILRALVARCNHVTHSEYSMSIQSIARLASGPLQHVVIDHYRKQLRNNVFRLGQKMDGPKYVTRNKIFIFLPSHVFAQTRSLQAPVTYRTTTTARTTFLSSAGQSAAVLVLNFTTTMLTESRRTKSLKFETDRRGLRSNILSVAI